jgi:hypothetical protein
LGTPNTQCSLASIIVKRGYEITSRQYAAILELVEGTSEAAELPLNLQTRVVGRLDDDA